MQGTKEGKSPCGLSIIATDFYVYVRDKYFFVYVLGGKEERKRRKTGDNPCELPSKDFCGYVIDKFQCTCGRKEGKRTLVDCILQILTSVYTLVLIWLFPFFFPPQKLCV